MKLVNIKSSSIKLLFYLSFLLYSATSSAQVNLPNITFFNNQIYKTANDDTSHFYHLSLKPFQKVRYSNESLNKQNDNWIKRKLFSEHFLIFSGDDYWCVIDPVVDAEIGYEHLSSSKKSRYWNTRGIIIQAEFLNKFSFETKVYETQSVLLDYQKDFVDEHGEFGLNYNKTLYKQQNGVVPGYSRTKPFGENGYDFAYAEGSMRYQVNSTFNVQFGNGNHFIGNGHRSLFLSDFTTNYPFIKPEINLFDNRIQYNVIFATLQNLYRLPYSSTPEASYERNSGVFHYLDLVINKNFKIGLFEGSIFQRTDSLGSIKKEFYQFNPIIGINSIGNSSNYNGIFGLDFLFTLNRIMFYGQAILDQNKISGKQLGVKLHNNEFNGLEFNIEYNSTSPNTYLSNNKRLNYGHSNLPLAHPLSAGFKEGIVKLSYDQHNFFISNKLVYSERVDVLSENNGVNILLSKTDEFSSNFNNNVLFHQLEGGYRLNKKNNLQLYFGYLQRISIYKLYKNNTSFVYFGIRTRLKNKTLDW